MSTTLRAAILAVVLLPVLLGLAQGQEFLPAVFVNLDEVQGLTVDGYIPEGGTDLVIPVRFMNVDVARTAISNGFDFTGDMTYTSLSGEWNPAYPWDWPHAIPLGIFPPFFDQGTFINYFTNGVGFAGLTGASGTGLPATFDGIAYYITLTGVGPDPGSVLVMDSTWWPPANYWLWSGVAGNVSWGGPYEFESYIPCCCVEPYTECWPQPTVLKALENDRILEFYVYCQDPTVVDMASVRVNGIPNYLNDGVAVYDAGYNRIWTNAFIMRFLGASGFRPIPPEGIHSAYTVTYNKSDGAPVSVVGDYVLSVYQGDVNFDTIVDLQDAICLIQYLFEDGPKATLHGEEVEELMDVDGSGRFDLLDIQATLQLANL